MATNTVRTVTGAGWHRHRQGQGSVESRVREEAETPTMVEGEHRLHKLHKLRKLRKLVLSCGRRVSYGARQSSRRSGPSSGVVAGIIVPGPICYCSPLPAPLSSWRKEGATCTVEKGPGVAKKHEKSKS